MNCASRWFSRFRFGAALAAVAVFLLAFEVMAQTPEQVEIAKKVVSCKNMKFRAFWEIGSRDPNGGDWEKTASAMEESGYNALLIRMCSAGDAYYPSKIVPHVCQSDRVKDCLAACKRHNIKMHVWLVCYNASEGAPASYLNKLRSEGRMQKTVDGRQVDWLCPSDPRNVKHHCDLITEMLKMYPDIAGIHLDFIRYDGSQYCFCEGCRQRFSAKHGEVKNWPADVRSGGPRWKEYNDWRKEQIRNLVVAAGKATHKAKRRCKFSVAVWVGIWVDGIAQDWFPWMKDGLVDFACPMNYTNSVDEFKKWNQFQLDKCGRKIPIYPGIAEYKNDLTGTLRQMEACVDQGFDGYVIFKMSPNSMNNILPVVKKGLEESKSSGHGHKSGKKASSKRKTKRSKRSRD